MKGVNSRGENLPIPTLYLIFNRAVTIELIVIVQPVTMLRSGLLCVPNRTSKPHYEHLSDTALRHAWCYSVRDSRSLHHDPSNPPSTAVTDREGSHVSNRVTQREQRGSPRLELWEEARNRYTTSLKRVTYVSQAQKRPVRRAVCQLYRWGY